MKQYFSNRPVFAIFLAIFMDFIAIGLTITILPAVFKDEERNLFSALVTQENRDIMYGLLSGLFFVGTFIGSPILGALSDRVGRRKLLLLTASFSAVGFLFVTLGLIYKIIPLIFIGRFISGLLGSMLIIINSSLADVSTQETKARNFGVTGMAFGIAISIGTVIGAILSDPSIHPSFDYHIPYFLSFVVISINLIFITFFFPETYAGSPTEEVSLFSGPKNVKKAFSDPKLRGMFIVIFVLSLGFTLYIQFFQIFLENKYKLDNVRVGAILVWIGLWISFAQGVVLRFFSKRYKPKQILQVSMPGFAFVYFLLMLQDTVLGFVLLLPFFAIMQGLSFPNTLAIVSNRASEHIQGEIIGLNQSVQNLAGTAPVFLGILVARFMHFPLYFGMICSLVAWLLFYILVLRQDGAEPIEATHG